MRPQLTWWWYIAPAYLTAWTVGFSAWNLIDGTGMMSTFGVDIGAPTAFIMLNSAGRYVALAAAMLVGIWIFRTYASIMTALIARLVMDALDLYAGLATGLIVDAIGVLQSVGMFLLPNLFAIVTLQVLIRGGSNDTA
ncbi:MAG: hypothetical protein AAFY34_03245 [Pseudomonadota bacterium]